MKPSGQLLGEPEGLGLREGIRLLRKHWRLIALCFIGSLSVTAAIILLTPPQYTAKATLLIERNTPQVLDFREIMGEQRDSEMYDFYKTQYEILKSYTLAARVLREQSREDAALFTTNLPKPGIFAKLWMHVTRRESDDLLPRSKDDPGEEAGAIEVYLKMLEIQPVPRTQLVHIAFHSPSSELSARLANAHTHAYIRRGVELRTRTNEEAQSFLEEKLVELKARMEKSEAELNRYRRNKGIISLDEKENIVVERLSDLNRRLTEAEAARIGLEGQVSVLRKANPSTLPAVVNNTLIQTLTSEAARLEAEYAHVATIFKPGHPRLDQLKAQINETRRQLRGEIQHTVASIESAYLAAAATEKELRSGVEAQKRAALQMKDTSVGYAILAREVDTNRQLYDSVLQRMKEAGVAAELRASNVSIIDQAPPRAFPPSRKSSKASCWGHLSA